jgi:hypothetical protein
MILSLDLECLYERTYNNDMFIIDYELTYHSSLLVLLIEDNLSSSRELAVIDYKTDECVQPPSLSFNHLFSVRGIFNTHLLVASRDTIYSFQYHPNERIFKVTNVLRKFAKRLEWI